MRYPLRVLGVSSRAERCLSVYGCNRIGDVAKRSEDTISRMRNLGKITAVEIARVPN